jgi:hypothetical protein
MIKYEFSRYLDLSTFGVKNFRIHSLHLLATKCQSSVENQGYLQCSTQYPYDTWLLALSLCEISGSHGGEYEV